MEQDRRAAICIHHVAHHIDVALAGDAVKADDRRAEVITEPRLQLRDQPVLLDPEADEGLLALGAVASIAARGRVEDRTWTGPRGRLVDDPAWVDQPRERSLPPSLRRQVAETAVGGLDVGDEALGDQLVEQLPEGDAGVVAPHDFSGLLDDRRPVDARSSGSSAAGHGFTIAGPGRVFNGP